MRGFSNRECKGLIFQSSEQVADWSSLVLVVPWTVLGQASVVGRFRKSWPVDLANAPLLAVGLC